MNCWNVRVPDFLVAALLENIHMFGWIQCTQHSRPAKSPRQQCSCMPPTEWTLSKSKRMFCGLDVGCGAKKNSFVSLRHILITQGSSTRVQRQSRPHLIFNASFEFDERCGESQGLVSQGLVSQSWTNPESLEAGKQQQHQFDWENSGCHLPCGGCFHRELHRMIDQWTWLGMQLEFSSFERTTKGWTHSFIALIKMTCGGGSHDKKELVRLLLLCQCRAIANSGKMINGGWMAKSHRRSTLMPHRE